MIYFQYMSLKLPVCIKLAVTAVLLFIVSVPAQNSNKQQLFRLADSVISSHSDGGTTLLLFAAPESLGQLKVYAEQKSAATDRAGSGKQSVIHLLDTKIDYVQLNAGWFSDDEYLRKVTLRYSVTSGNTLKPGEVSISDTVAFSAITHLEEEGSPFRGEIPAQTGIKSYLEPVALTLLTGGMVYLFYSVRGK